MSLAWVRKYYGVPAKRGGRARTRYWYAPKDVAVCPACSAVKSISEVPTKQEWLENERSRP